MWPAKALACLLLTLLLAAASGCGSSDSSDDEEPAPHPKPLGPPKAEESIDQAAKSLQKALDSGNCKAINDFNPISRQEALSTKDHCKALRARLSDAKVSGSESFQGAGVIDFQLEKRTITALMAVDEDGRYHLVGLDGFIGKPSVGTPFAQQFDAAADAAVKALGDKDCDAFLKVASRQLGVANITRSEKDVCEFVKNNRIAPLVEARPDLAPRRLGGNGDYAFYGMGIPATFITIVMARQTDAHAAGTPRIPSDAAKYAYVDALPTNSARSADGASSN